MRGGVEQIYRQLLSRRDGTMYQPPFPRKHAVAGKDMAWSQPKVTIDPVKNVYALDGCGGCHRFISVNRSKSLSKLAIISPEVAASAAR